MRASIIHDRMVWWPRIPTNSFRTLIPASDPSVPPGIPVVVDVVARQIGRDAVQTPNLYHPVRPGSLVVADAWVRHDPACPAATHVPLRLLTNEVVSGASNWAAIVAQGPVAATGAWVNLRASRRIMPAGASEVRIAVSIDQSGATNPSCTWWVADDRARIIG